jgi:hypothetical protein
MVTTFEHSWGTGDQGTYLIENEERGKGNTQKGMKKTHLMAFVLGPWMKDLTDPIPVEDLEEIKELAFEEILKYAVKLEYQ